MTVVTAAARSATPDGPIQTDRLTLELLRPETLRALLAHDVPRASACQGHQLPRELLAADGSDDLLLAFHHEQLRDHPDVRGWCIRVMVRRSDGVVVGSCGFHGPPRAVGRAEIGYWVAPAYRDMGYATEGARALVWWAFERGERTVFASVAPANAPSLAVVRKIGFIQTGSQRGDDGEEELVLEVREATARH